MTDRGDGDGPVDLASRVPCPDGACVGVIGADGRCGTCGKPAESADVGEGPAAASTPPPAAGAFDAGPPAPPPGEDDEGGPPVDDENVSPDLASRVLCPDERCTGVIGPDGRCGICGRPFAA